MINFDEYEWWGDDMFYNPINDVPERNMTKEEFEEYINAIEERQERRKNEDNK